MTKCKIIPFINALLPFPFFERNGLELFQQLLLFNILTRNTFIIPKLKRIRNHLNLQFFAFYVEFIFKGRIVNSGMFIYCLSYELMDGVHSVHVCWWSKINSVHILIFLRTLKVGCGDMRWILRYIPSKIIHIFFRTTHFM